ncbi:MAG: DUF3368 domain-containing protein [Candidatus Poribacteria bacterium]
MMSVIANNTVLSNFAVVDRLDFLRQLYGKVYLTPEVFEEVEDGIKSGRLFQKRTKQSIKNQEWLFVIELESHELSIFVQFAEKLHIGESSCLAIAKVRKWLFLTDDRRAKRKAFEVGVEVIGTVGLLRIAIDEKIISTSEGNSILEDMIKNGYYSPVQKLDDIF